MSFKEQASPEAREIADVVRNSIDFDPDFYLAHTEDSEASLDPALHYVLFGEARGVPASSRFYATVYTALNPDLASLPSLNKLWHYETSGRVEGRSLVYESENVGLDHAKIDPGKPNIMLLLHEASFSGAPILGWNLLNELRLTRNVIVVVQKGGDLLPSLQKSATVVVGPMSSNILAVPGERKRLAERLSTFYRPTYVIANSIETRLLACALRDEGVPYIALVHEFATHAPPHSLNEFYKRCAGIVFPAEIVMRSSLRDYGLIAQRATYTLPQGQSRVPLQNDGVAPRPGNDLASGERPSNVLQLLSQSSECFTVFGLGAIDLRKGVDIFVSTAAAIRRKHPDLRFRFIWVGERVHEKQHQYNVFLQEQIERSGLEEDVYLLPPVGNLDCVYAAADALYISSRLDPLPNVGIDAAVLGIPIVCFRNATGFAAILTENEMTSELACPYLDVEAAAAVLAKLAHDTTRRRTCGEALRRMARRTFNMPRYADRLDKLGIAAAERMKGIEAESLELIEADAFDAPLYFTPPTRAPANYLDAVKTYLDETREVDFSGTAVWGDHPRRPLAGFHPLIYGAHSSSEGARSPLVDFVRNGRPVGPWLHQVVRLDEKAAPVASRLKVALHGHFHYVDNIADFMSALSVNISHMDLFLTTSSDRSASILRKATDKYMRGSVQIQVSDNKGRDVRPFIELLDEVGSYDLVGHLHGKRSAHTYDFDPELGNRWRKFLWQHLIGPAAPVADVILRNFEVDDTLGLVFPENDFLVGWEKNFAIAQALAPRLGLDHLPDHLDFPVGTMFWARPCALRALVEARFAEAEYPDEPLPIDGTMLHALERMIPLVVQAAGYRSATTYFPLFSR